MGGKKSKQAGGKDIKVPNKKQGLDSKDLKFLQEQTGLSQEQIKAFYSEFMANNPDGQLDRQEFVRLYAKFRSEPLDRIDEISQYVFRAFDGDNNGSISFGEFLVAYSLTSRGDVKQKLEYAFEMYDADNNGYLDSAELKTVIHGMLDLLGADEKGNDSNLLAKDTIQQLDKNHDGKIRKDEFVSGCLANYALRSLLSPFS